MNIPQFPQVFTRVRLCHKCLINHKPYHTSEDLQHHKLQFVVLSQSKGDPTFVLRHQTKPGRVGFTPHFYHVDDTPIILNDVVFFAVRVGCSVIGCGSSRELIGPGKIETLIEIQEVFYKTEKEIIDIYNFKDESYQLDRKESQFYTTPEMVSKYHLN